MKIKWIIPFLLFILLSLTGCPNVEDAALGSINIYMNGQAISSSVNIQKGQTITLIARADNEDIRDLIIVWEITGSGAVISDAVIINSGIGEEVQIRGGNVNTTGNIALRVRAWRAGTDRQRSKTISLFVRTPVTAEGIAGISGPLSIGVNEEQIISAELIPSWADGNVTWSQSPAGRVEFTPIPGSKSCKVKGLTAGDVTITAATGAFTKTFNLQVTPGKTGNPVTAVRVRFADAENSVKPPVSNIIWLYPGDSVTLEAECTGGVPNTVTWTTDNLYEVKVNNGDSHTGTACTLTGIYESEFNSPAAVVRVTAQNSDNANPVTATVLVKTQAKPVWAWDRARDGHLNTDITPPNPTTSELPADTPRPTLSSYESAVNYKMRGRGEYSESNPGGIPVKVKGNFIPYSSFGLLLNSSNNFSGNNPDPVASPKYGSITSATSYNSTRIMIGTNNHANTDSNVHQDGIFDFLTPGKNIRVSVDYEIIWSAGASRDMWIMVNNNNANAAQSYMGTNSQLLIEPLIAARGTKATAVTTLDVLDLVNNNIKGFETLEKAFIAVIALSNGGSIYVSGIRIEKEN